MKLRIDLINIETNEYLSALFSAFCTLKVITGGWLGKVSVYVTRIIEETECRGVEVNYSDQSLGILE